MKAFWESLYLSRFTFILLAVISLCYVLGHFYPAFLWAGHILFICLFLLIALDLFLLYRGRFRMTAQREMNKILSNGDENPYKIVVENRYNFPVSLRIYDELPYQLDRREEFSDVKIPALRAKEIENSITPKLRGQYLFGNIIALVKSPIRLIIRKYVLAEEEEIAVYPSYIHLNKYNLKNFKYTTREFGNKQTRKIGHSQEFEQIKEYVKGDDIRHINWKASAKRAELMVNQYVDERAQKVYCVVDSGRTMQMPFDGMSLLDYAINSSLSLCHIIIRKQDHAGLIHFNKQVERIIPANKGVSQLPKILNTLHNLKTEFFESNFEKLYVDIKFKINQRSLIILFTNFEEMDALNRQIPYLRGIAKNNVLLVVFFKNREVDELLKTSSTRSTHYYKKAIAEKLIMQKTLMVKTLKKHGIQTLLTDPKTLTTDTINKYLEIKTKGLI